MNGERDQWDWQRHNKAISEAVDREIQTFLHFQKDGKKKKMKPLALTFTFMKKVVRDRGCAQVLYLHLLEAEQ